jgi:glucosamine-6-phosphate deaminase
MSEHAPRLDIVADAATAVDYVALQIIATLHNHERPTLGLATGATMEPLYAGLVAAYHNRKVSFRSAISFNLDEYVGVDAKAPGSFHAYMRAHLFDHVDMVSGQAHIPNGLAADMSAEAARYEALIRDAGGIDLQLLGIGANGHIGFNEPGSDFSSRTREVRLDEATRRANAASFSGQTLAPQCAITMGIGTILEARHIVLLATGAEKADAVACMMEGPLTEACPASALRLHDDVQVICDAAAAGKLTQRRTLLKGSL